MGWTLEASYSIEQGYWCESTRSFRSFHYLLQWRAFQHLRIRPVSGHLISDIVLNFPFILLLLLVVGQHSKFSDRLEVVLRCRGA